MSYQGQTWVDEVALPHLNNTGELIIMLRVANHAGNGPKKMSGCHASAKTLARESLMGHSTALKHLRELRSRGLLIPGDPALVAHLPADKRPPVYDLAGAHEPGCVGGHTYLAECSTAGVQIEHPLKKSRSAGVRSEHPQPKKGGAGVQIDAERVFKSSTKSSKELKESSLSPGASPSSSAPDASAGLEGEREAAEPKNNPDAVRVLAAFQEAGGLALNGTRTQFLRDAAALLESRPLWWLIDRAKEMPGNGWTDLARHAAKSKVPFAQPQRKPTEGMCLRHPSFPEDDCLRCRKEEAQRLYRPRSEPAPVNGSALLASLLQNSPTG